MSKPVKCGSGGGPNDGSCGSCGSSGKPNGNGNTGNCGSSGSANGNCGNASASAGSCGSWGSPAGRAGRLKPAGNAGALHVGRAGTLKAGRAANDGSRAATLGAAVLPAHAAPSVAARRVVARLSAALAADAELAACAPRGGFRVRVVDAPETPNALALPGGDVFVFSGLLSVADTDARLAAVLAHEMAHALARHAAEQLSARRFWSLLVSAARGLVFPDVPALPAHAAAELLVHLPYSRACEAEADALGLRLMAAACYPPEAALELWAAMARFEEQRGGPGVAGRLPAFLSTHPPHGERARRITELLPAARAVFEASGCAEPLRVSAMLPRRRSAP